ncbi:rhodanese-like domain-containing protein [Cellulomonas fengjieae]|uniref:rhodanese-like domain-containing protein n=1 Tax=Cellulomonas fengjieae TaxID=2819978 RepID=UPI001AAE457D|nr:rhodanese-like domain-containing protein [Cellulomonas fengjieae]MBO3100469.1 rhodanese-like domain-containing protein [Cellulomonas fengjieae]
MSTAPTSTSRRSFLDRLAGLVVVCASGMRSRSGAQQLRSVGFQAASLSGGMAAWQRAGGEVPR